MVCMPLYRHETAGLEPADLIASTMIQAVILPGLPDLKEVDRHEHRDNRKRAQHNGDDCGHDLPFGASGFS